MKKLTILSIFMTITGLVYLPSFAKLPPPPGKYIAPNWHDFSGSTYYSHSYIVGTYYFYWYCTKTGNHIVDADHTDACTDHQWNWIQGTTNYYGPPKAPVFCWDEKAWHSEQLADIEAAHLDFLMPVYWGIPGDEHTGENYWSWPGVKTLVEAMKEREAQGKKVLKIGLFYDDTTLRGVDLTSEAGKEQFYGTIRDFYSMVPPKYWLRIDSKVVVWLYHSAWPSKVSKDAFNYAKSRFAQDFGGNSLIFIGDPGWNSRGGHVDLTYEWGAAVKHGAKVHDICSVGPGFDNHAIPGGGNPEITTPRNGGQYYTNSWNTVLHAPCGIVSVETWNEYHESTDIAHSFEYGRKYIDLTRDFAIKYKFRARFLKGLYRYVLGRDPDPSGLESWGEVLISKGPDFVRDGVLDSVEARQNMSDEDYISFIIFRYVGPNAPASLYSTYLGILKGGKTRSQVRDQLINSAESKNVISDEEYVTGLYRGILGRAPDQGGKSHYLQMLRQGKKRTEIRDEILGSEEFKMRIFNYDPKTLSGIFDPTALKFDTCKNFYKDADHDGYGDDTKARCLYHSSGVFTAKRGGDCNDNDPNVPSCKNKECGDDGCGNSCGTCNDHLSCTTDTCNAAGRCEFKVEHGCLINNKCYSNGQKMPGNPCMQCSDANPDTWTPVVDGTSCGSNRVCCNGQCCGLGNKCYQGSCCMPKDCSQLGVECGGPYNDGCGSTIQCGGCSNGYKCENGHCVQSKGCGDGICQATLGEDCSTCPADCGCKGNEVCYQGYCCTPGCQGKECGDNGCGGSCGICNDNNACTVDSCNQGKCVFTPRPKPNCLSAGVCSQGVKVVCNQSSGQWECDYKSIPNWEEDEHSCDGLDNDCDGQTDEGCQSDPGSDQDVIVTDINGSDTGQLEDVQDIKDARDTEDEEQIEDSSAQTDLYETSDHYEENTNNNQEDTFVPAHDVTTDIKDVGKDKEVNFSNTDNGVDILEIRQDTTSGGANNSGGCTAGGTSNPYGIFIPLLGLLILGIRRILHKAN